MAGILDFLAKIAIAEFPDSLLSPMPLTIWVQVPSTQGAISQSPCP